MNRPFVGSAQPVPGVVKVALRGGAATLRPLGPEEGDALDAVFVALSPASRYDRYLTGVGRLTGPMRSALMDIDGDRQVAWLGEVDGRPAAIGRLVRVAPRAAEVALEVVDAHQGRGLGTALLDALMTIASVTEIDVVQATVLPGNQRSRRLLARVQATLRMQDGVLEAVAPARLRNPPVVDRSAVVRLALGARTTRAEMPASA